MSLRDSKDLIEFWRIESAQSPCFVLAELVRTEGSTYRKVGAKKIISKNGSGKGLISGGCLEGAITSEALKYLNENGPSEVMFDTTNESDRLLGFQKGCRGKIWLKFSKLPKYDFNYSREIFTELKDPRRLVIFGCGPDAIPLSELLGSMGYSHLMVDHRKDLVTDSVTHQNFHFAEEVIYETPTTSAQRVREGDATILMSHSFEADLNIMAGLVGKKLSYVGILGPRSRFEQLKSDLKNFFEKDWPESLQSVTFAPVGLNLLCKDSHDIALAIVAQLQSLQIFNSQNLAAPICTEKAAVAYPQGCEIT